MVRVLPHMLFAVFVVALYLPLVTIPVFSFNDSIYLSLPMAGFTTQWYADMLANSQLLGAVNNSIKVGIVAAIAATAIATLASLSLARRAGRGKRITALALMQPMVIPSLILGVGMLSLMINAGIELGLMTITLGHILINIPISLLIMLPRMEAFEPSLIEASLDMGESRGMTFLRVTLPLISGSLLASFIVCFLTSFDEFLIAFMLGGAEQTLPMYIFSQLRFPNKLPEVLAVSSCVMLLSIAGLVAASALWKKK